MLRPRLSLRVLLLSVAAIALALRLASWAGKREAYSALARAHHTLAEHHRLVARWVWMPRRGDWEECNTLARRHQEAEEAYQAAATSPWRAPPRDPPALPEFRPITTCPPDDMIVPSPGSRE